MGPEVQSNLEKINNVGDFNTYYKAVAIKAVLYWYKAKHRLMD